ncbi:hypothetical protein THF1D04_120092 [Vibrio owensii]|uniref:Uncharacterized protein n=1 Tax=Vibrio owensii TaxID=696485 RepID=A0AAU9Q1A0_9VIBR|nr:hypothetical protein THF1D04_120092 [Vibrio owensii]
MPKWSAHTLTTYFLNGNELGAFYTPLTTKVQVLPNSAP